MSLVNTILTINGYGILKKNNEELILKIKEDLTITPSNHFDSTNVKSFPIYSESEKRIYIPRCYGLQKYGAPINDKLNLDDCITCNNLVFEGKLRDQQVDPVNNFINAANDKLKRGGILSVPCGFGKTLMSIYIACHFKKKTLFISHKDFLNQQFIESVKQFVPKARIGLIKQSKVDVKDKDIVVASLQSLAMRDYDMEIFKEFGLVIIDECHHMSAEVFCRAFQKINAPIILGLSATLNRKDGLRKVFEYFIGKSVYKFKKDEHIEVNIELHKYYVPDITYSCNKVMFNGKPNSPAMINNICSYKPRTEYIIQIIKRVLAKEKTRKILILSERRQQLVDIDELLVSSGISKSKDDIGYYVGGLSQAALDISSTKQIILATYQMASEGMNIPSLNTAIFASPISDITQSLGRILREKPNERKYVPLCIDIMDEFSIFTRKGYARIKNYKSNNYTINYYIDNVKVEMETEENRKDKKYTFINDDD